MTKRGFEALAGALRDTGESWLHKVADETGTVEPADSPELARATRAHALYVSAVANVLAAENPRFDRNRFKDAGAVRNMCAVRTGVGLCLHPCEGNARTCKHHS